MFKVLVSKSASRELRALPAQVIGRIVAALQKLETDPRPSGSKKLKGGGDVWRIRVGDYRIIYAIEDILRIIDIRKIGHRKDVYE
jgi:mRNA interferase RelE/StbE